MKAAVVGDPIEHSFSPAIFGAFSKALGRPLSYRALRVRPENLAAEIEKAARDGTVGWNVTLPHKVAILSLLDGLDASAKRVGAVNVVRFSTGRRMGYNTDLEGFLSPLDRLKFPLRGKRALVFGAGGAARAVCAALKDAGARVAVSNRTPAKALALALEFGLEEVLEEADLIVNATPAAPLPLKVRLRPGAVAYDLVYRPLKTPFLAAAYEAGARTLGGLGMLVAQAAATWRIWFKEEVPADVLDSVERDLERSLR